MKNNKIFKIAFGIGFIFLSLFIIYCFINIYYNKSHANIDEELQELTELSFNTKQYKMDSIQSDTILQYTFILKNIGDKPLFIRSINPSCLCTSYYLSKKEITQQDTAKIVLTVNTKDKKGFYEINTVVIANTKEKYYLLKLIGEIGR